MPKPLREAGFDVLISHLIRMSEDKVRFYQHRSSPTQDLAYLYCLCSTNNVRNVIEIGTFRGLSAVTMATACSGTVHTINKERSEIVDAKKLANELEIENIVFHEGDSLEILPKLTQDLAGDYQLGYIDGWHSYHYAMSEYKLIDETIDKSNGVIIFDDAAKVHPEGEDDGGVPRVLEELGIEPEKGFGRRIAWKKYGSARTL